LDVSTKEHFLSEAGPEEIPQHRELHRRPVKGIREERRHGKQSQ
jgi:hypothetical protein